MKYKELIEYIEEIGNDDTDCERLEKAFDFYCGAWERCEGYKLAITNELKDQYQNHESEQDPKDIGKIYDILNGAI